MGLNPHSDSNVGFETSEIIGLEGAEVITTKSHTKGDNVSHEVAVKPDSIDTTVPADVQVSQIGDVAIPEEGDRVLIGYRVEGRATVLGSRYSESDTLPDFEPGERIIGHPASDSYVRLKADGTVHAEGDGGGITELQSDGTVHVESDGGATVDVKSNGDVVVNGGSTKPVTDVSVSTQTDGDGHVTSVSLNITRTSDVFVP